MAPSWMGDARSKAYHHPLIHSHTVLSSSPYAWILNPATKTRCQENPELRHDDHEEHCRTCLYTGVATCAGISIYYLKLAYLDLPEEGSKAFTKEIRNQRRFYSGFAAVWIAAGAYRWYLG